MVTPPYENVPHPEIATPPWFLKNLNPTDITQYEKSLNPTLELGGVHTMNLYYDMQNWER